MSGCYHEIRCLVDRQGALVIGILPLASARAMAETLGIASVDPAPEHDRRLLQRSFEQDDAATLLCLRCRISHPIEALLGSIHRPNHKKYGLDLIDMASYVLDDAGGSELRSGLPFCWSALLAQSAGKLHPFSAEVLRSYEPSRSSLSLWARTAARGNTGLKAYLRQHGLLLISDWALLADITQTRNRNAWQRCGPGALTAEQAAALHQAYCQHYGPAKDAYRKITGRNSGWSPLVDPGFLEAIAPGQSPATTAEHLQAMARAIRHFMAGDPSRAVPAEEEADALADSATLSSVVDTSEVSDASELRQRITAALDRAAAAALEAALTADQPRWATGPERRLTWQLYGEGLTQRNIAERAGHKQAWVSKLLGEKDLANTIATAAAVELRRHPAFAGCGRSVEAAERLVSALRNHLLEPEQERDVAPLRQAVARILATLAP